MAYELLLQSISERVPLTHEEAAILKPYLKEKKLKKKHFLFQEGDMAQQIAFVNNGCLRSYAIDKNGAEHILQFAPSGWWLGDMKSILYNQPATLNADAIEDSEIILVRQSDLEYLYKIIPVLERYFRILAERSLATFQQRLVDSLSLTASERYSRFCERYPSLIQTLPQKYVASYIGITPEFLSKMLSQPMKRS